MSFNLKYIDPNFDKNQIVDSTNDNFNQIYFASTGLKGDYGPRGSVGPKGQIGPPGPTGPTGERGTKWFRQNAEPTSEVKIYDKWINTSPGSTGSESIYNFNGTSWVYTGQTLSSGSVFRLYSQIIGPAGLNTSNAILINSVDPSQDTLVLSDLDSESNTVNPNYSKVKLSLDGNSTSPLLTFYKIGYVDPQPPSIYWKSQGYEDHGISFRGSGSLRLNSGEEMNLISGSSSSVGASGSIDISSGSITISSISDTKIQSGGTSSNEISTEFLLSSNFSISSNNFSISASQNSFNYGLYIDQPGSTADSLNYRLDITAKLPDSNTIGALDVTMYDFETWYPTSQSFKLGEDFRLQGQLLGEGPFRTETVIADKGDFPLDPPTPYVKYGKPKTTGAGVTGSYNVYGVNNVSGNYSLVSIPNEGSVRVVNLSSTSYYSNSIINLTTTNSVTSTLNVWVRIPSPTSTTGNLSGVYWSSDVTTYRFFYNGNSNGGNINTGYKFGGIIYTENGIDKKIDFNTPTRTFELSYHGNSYSFFYKTFDTYGIAESIVSAGGGNEEVTELPEGPGGPAGPGA